jgi:hypothetical protein
MGPARQPTTAGGAGERIRFCLACGEVLAFEQRTCPSCGHLEPSPPVEEQPGEQITFCVVCGTEKPVRLIFCPSCGREPGEPTAALPLASAPRETPGARLAGASAVLALLAPLLLLLALAELVYVLRAGLS